MKNTAILILLLSCFLLAVVTAGQQQTINRLEAEASRIETKHTEEVRYLRERLGWPKLDE